MRGFYQKLSAILSDIAVKDYGITLEPPFWEIPPRQEFGDLSTAIALRMTARLGRPPMDIAGELKTKLEAALGQEAAKIDILQPGFVNIFLSQAALADGLNDLMESGESFFSRNIPRKVLIEFCSANPTGPLSIAHGRQAVIGDTIANILKFFGNSVEKEYYVNDAGRQLDLLVVSVRERIKEIRGEQFSIPEDGYQGEYVKDIARAYLDSGNGSPIKPFVLTHALGLIKSSLSSLGIEYDLWTSQQKLIDDGKVSGAMDLLKDRGMLFEQDNALWFSSTKFGDDKDRVLRKGDGELTYFASDIALHKDKIERGHEKLIALWGPDHHGYIPRVKAAIQALGYNQDIFEVLIIQLVSIKTKERMSRRKGTAVLLSDLTEDVGKDAVRFYYLTRRNSSLLEFDIDLAKETSVNNPLYYIQYACARIESIFKKAEGLGIDPACSRFLASEDELRLLRTLLQCSYALEKAYYSLEPVFIIEYLKNLAAAVHKFYERCRVMGEDPNTAKARLNLLSACRLAIHCALRLLGITPVEKM